MKARLIPILQIFLGLIFILSGLLKLFPIHAFEMSLIGQYKVDPGMAPYLSRSLIVFELVLGIAMILGWQRKIVTGIIVLLTAVFSIAITLVWVGNGNMENCGCFGELIPMGPLESIIKNIVIIGIGLYLFLKQSSANLFKRIWMNTGMITMVSLIVFIFFPITVIPSDPVQEGESATASIDWIPSSLMSDSTYVDFTSGENLVAVLDLDCSHCQEVAAYLDSVNSIINIPEIYMFLQGNDERINELFVQLSGNYKYRRVGAQEFFSLLDVASSAPRVVLLKNGNVLKDWDYNNIMDGQLEAHF